MTDQPARTVLITGSARGLGLAMARAFLSSGYRVALADLSEQSLGETVQSLAADHSAAAVIGIPVDVTDDDAVEQLLARVTKWAGALDVLVNNAGALSRSSTELLPTASWAKDLDVNVGGAFRCARAAFPHLCASPYPSVLNIGSLGSSLGMPGRASYNTSKAGVLGLTRTLAAEWGPLGIRSNAITPGFIDTAMMRSGLDTGALDEDLIVRRIPMRRLGAAEEVAGVALFLSSPAASYINGATIPVDGGTTIDGTFS